MFEDDPKKRAAAEDAFARVDDNIPLDHELQSMTYLALCKLLSSCEKGSAKLLIERQKNAGAIHRPQITLNQSGPYKSWQATNPVITQMSGTRSLSARCGLCWLAACWFCSWHTFSGIILASFESTSRLGW